MRLIEAKTSHLVSFIDKEVPKYAILSHTWGNDELTFADLMNSKPSYDTRWAKLLKTCKLTLEHGLEYCWIDTCCIDKSSSAELTESINSMYRWYAESEVCLAYLSDLEDGKEFDSKLSGCRWSSRGWTLQELIAPKVVKFYDKSWAPCGTKAEHASSIAASVGLPVDVLTGTARVSNFCVAQKMSWAAKRVTTRPEDRSYCLLGIFDISMPLIYGEGPKAFRRLQQAIISQSNDLTILAWEWADSDGLRESDHERGLFAPSPACFHGNGRVTTSRGDFLEFSNTNKGLLIRGDMMLRVVRSGDRSESSIRYAFRVGWRGPSGHDGDYKIGLRRIGPNMFCRDHTTFYQPGKEIIVTNLSFFYLEEFYILEGRLVDRSVQVLLPPYRQRSLHIPATDMFSIRDARPRRAWDCQDALFLKPKSSKGSRYPNVLAVALKGTGCARGKHEIECAVLFDYRSEPPYLYLFDVRKQKNLSAVVLGDSTRATSLHWNDVRRQAPEVAQLTTSIVVPLHGEDTVLLAKLRPHKLVVDDCKEAVDVLSLAIEMKPLTCSRDIPVSLSPHKASDETEHQELQKPQPDS